MTKDHIDDWLRFFDELVTIVGVMREEFSGVNDTPPDVWVPLTMHVAIVKQDLFGPDQPREVAIIARLAVRRVRRAG